MSAPADGRARRRPNAESTTSDRSTPSIYASSRCRSRRRLCPRLSRRLRSSNRSPRSRHRVVLKKSFLDILSLLGFSQRVDIGPYRAVFSVHFLRNFWRAGMVGVGSLIYF
jgi:hypothetical protein